MNKIEWSGEYPKKFTITIETQVRLTDEKQKRIDEALRPLFKVMQALK